MLTIKGLSLQSSNGIDVTYDNQLLLERVGRIIMTYRSERVNNPEFGSLLETFLFNRGSILEQHVYSSLANTIEVYEPRVRVLNINIRFDDEEQSAHITINVIRRDNSEILTFEESIAI